ncbi:MAG: hypothetical protein NT164_09090 [Verrucomicrobiae bacterium]|nr:hypothetical protein [Verrucomicrobiae bacterium]
MKKYIIVLLALASVHTLLADTTVSPGSIQLSPSGGEAASSMRVITQDEFDEKVPIVINVNQSLIIPIHYQRYVITNTPQIFFGPQDSPLINVSVGGVNWSNNGMTLDLNLVCTGAQVGPTAVRFGEAGQVVKEFNIQVVE